MIPILFDESATTYTTNGLGRLADAISCTVTEERNGKYELEMEYPITGIHFEELIISRQIFAVPADGKSEQPFRIYRIDRMINGRAKVYAEHVTYQANYIPVMPFTAGTAAECMVKLNANAVAPNPFTLWTDVNKTGTYSQEIPESIRARLGGQDGSVLDIYGGEFEWDKYTIKLRASRGSDNGVTLRYGKNITDLTQEKNISSTYTAVCPYYKASEDEELITLPEKYIEASSASSFPFPMIKTVDMTDEFEDGEEVTVSALRTKTQDYITANNIGIPKVSIKVSFVALWQTEEYKEIAPLERVNLCDTVTVIFEKLGVSASAKVIKTVYNVLIDRYDSIEIGEAKSTMSAKVASQAQEIETEMSSHMEKAIKHATELITGGLGGYVVLKKNANGKPEEILIMDSPDMSTAVNVIRMNLSGIGFSHNGYNGPFQSAWTIDGHFVADFIDTGTLTADIIKAGVLTDEAGKFLLNMVTGELSMKDGEFTGTITGSTVQNAKTGHRIVMDTSSSLKGYNGNTLHNLINMEQAVSGSHQMTIDADTQLNIRTPKVTVIDQSYGEGSANAYVTLKNQKQSFVSNVTKNMTESTCKEVWAGSFNEDEGEVFCTLPVFLNITKSSRRIVNGMMTTEETTETVVI